MTPRCPPDTPVVVCEGGPEHPIEVERVDSRLVVGVRGCTVLVGVRGRDWGLGK